MSDRTRRRTVVLVRHGQTALNAEGRLRGLADPELTPTGIEQAHDTADALRRLDVGRVISSPLLRAVATAQIIADVTGAEFAVDPAWTDRDYGPWTGHRTADVIARWGGVNAAPGVEARPDVTDRALRALAAVLDAPAHAPTVVVTHDAIIRSLIGSLRPDLAPRIETGSWARLVHDGDIWTVASVDSAD